MDHSGCLANLIKIVEVARASRPTAVLRAWCSWPVFWSVLFGAGHQVRHTGSRWHVAKRDSSHNFSGWSPTWHREGAVQHFKHTSGCGVALGVSGAVATSYAPEVSASGGNTVKACVFYALQVLFGGAGFWHPQKRLLTAGYRSIEVVAWYYFYGVVLMGLVVLPNALESSLWRFSEADWIALAYGLAVWPLAAFLLAWSNSMATPVVVMALSPMQIVFTLGIEIALGKRSAFGSGGFGSTMQRTGIAAVVVGLASLSQDTQ